MRDRKPIEAGADLGCGPISLACDLNKVLSPVQWDAGSHRGSVQKEPALGSAGLLSIESQTYVTGTSTACGLVDLICLGTLPFYSGKIRYRGLSLRLTADDRSSGGANDPRWSGRRPRPSSSVKPLNAVRAAQVYFR